MKEGYLKDFGEDSFLFVFKDHIIYPDQFPLGYQPAKKDVETWMNHSRKIFSDYFLQGVFCSSAIFKDKLDKLGDQLDFNDLLSYKSIVSEELDDIILDFQNARKFLDSDKGVIIFE